MVAVWGWVEDAGEGAEGGVGDGGGDGGLSVGFVDRMVTSKAASRPDNPRAAQLAQPAETAGTCRRESHTGRRTATLACLCHAGPPQFRHDAIGIYRAIHDSPGWHRDQSPAQPVEVPAGERFPRGEQARIKVIETAIFQRVSVDRTHGSSVLDVYRRG